MGIVVWVRVVVATEIGLRIDCGSVLVPIDQTSISVLYVFVDIKIDSKHLIESIKANFNTSEA